MREIKAYLRPEKLESVIRDLERAGARDVTVIRVDAIGTMSGEDDEHRHLFRKYDSRYSAVAKLEIVCRDEDSPVFVEIIQRVARTGAHGDGRIFVTEVAESVNIRSGLHGEAAL